MTGLVPVGGAEQECVDVEYVDDFVVEPLAVTGERPVERTFAVAQRNFESARAFRLERRIAEKVVRKEAVEIEKGRLGDALAVGAGDRKAGANPREERGAHVGRILEAVEHVTTNRKIAGQQLGVATPFQGQSFMVAAAVLIGKAAVDRVARMEGLAFEVRSRDQRVRDRAGREAPFKLYRQVAPRAAGAVLLHIGKIVAI